MNRKEAKLLLEFSEVSLDELGLTTDKEVIKHYAEGGLVGHDESDGHVPSPDFNFSYKWHTEPRLINILGVEVEVPNLPLSEPKNHGDTVYVVSTCNHCCYYSMYWGGHNTENLALERGLVFDCEESAMKVGKAIKKKYFGESNNES